MLATFFLLLVSSNKHNVKMELKAIVFFPLFLALDALTFDS